MPNRRAILKAAGVLSVSFAGCVGGGSEAMLATSEDCYRDAIDELERFAGRPHDEFGDVGLGGHLAECKSALEEAASEPPEGQEDRIDTLERLHTVLQTTVEAVRPVDSGISEFDRGTQAVARGGQYRPPNPLDDEPQPSNEELRELYDGMRSELLEANTYFEAAVEEFRAMESDLEVAGDEFDALRSEGPAYEIDDATELRDAIRDLRVLARSMADFGVAFLHYNSATIVSNERGRAEVLGNVRYEDEENEIVVLGPLPRTSEPAYDVSREHFEQANEILTVLDPDDVVPGFEDWLEGLRCQLPHQIEATDHWHRAEELEREGRHGSAESHRVRGFRAEKRAFEEC